MIFIDDVAVLLGKPFDGELIEAVVGTRGQATASDYEPGHPEDERHYFMVPALGLQMLAEPDGTIGTVFFMLEGDGEVDAYPWSLKCGIGRASRPMDVRAQLGKPEASGPAMHLSGLPPTGPWDRFRFPPFGFLHVHYVQSGDGIAQMTLMSESAVPH